MTRGILQRSLLVGTLVLASAAAIFYAPVRLGLDLRGGASLIVKVKVDDVPVERRREVVEETRRSLERRINVYGLSEAPVQPYGSRGDELMVQLPGVSDPSHIKNLLQSRAVLEWYSVEGGPYSSVGEAMSLHGGILPVDRMLLPTKSTPNRAGGWYLLAKPPIVRGTDLRDARVAVGRTEEPVTSFVLSQEAAKRFGQYTETHIGRKSAIVLDDEILSVPVIEERIGDTGQIRGARTREEAEDLAMNLRAGALPAAISVEKQTLVEASLGADSIRHGLQAGAVSLAAVVATMLVYYRVAGANATLALLLNGVLLIAALACFGAVLTLPGIAGLVLTIGMAVDSNVLIFERIREEMRTGKSAPASLAAGFSKAISTLVDTHVTTVVSCAFLFFFGTPAVQGFAATLVIGLVTNLFTSVFVSRIAFDWELSRRGGRSQLSIGLAH